MKIELKNTIKIKIAIIIGILFWIVAIAICLFNETFHFMNDEIGYVLFNLGMFDLLGTMQLGHSYLMKEG